MSSSMIAVPARQTYGGFGEVDTIESIDAIADRDGSDDEILASIEEGYKQEYASSFPRGSGVRREGIYGYGGLGAESNIRQYQFCSGYPKPTPQEAYDARESLRRRMAAHGIRTYPAMLWQKEEQDAWNAFNVSRGLQPMKLGKYPMGKQCLALDKGPFKFTPPRAVAANLSGFGSLYGNKSNGIRRFFPRGGYQGFGEGTLTINGTSVPVDTSGLGMAIAKTAVYAVLGYYVGGKLGPASSSSAAAGAVACAFGGPIGLAIVAAYYGGKR